LVLGDQYFAFPTPSGLVAASAERRWSRRRTPPMRMAMRMFQPQFEFFTLKKIMTIHVWLS